MARVWMWLATGFVALSLLGVTVGCESDSDSDGAEDAEGTDPTLDTGESPSDAEGEDPVDTEGGEEDSSTEGGLADEASWRPLDLGEATTWNGIDSFGTGGTAQYVLAGGNGAVAVYDGNTPTFINLGIAESMLDVWAASDTEIFVCGTGGILRQWDADNSEWLAPDELPPQGDNDFTTIAGSSATNVYMGTETGQIWRYTGDGWFQVINDQGESPAGTTGIDDIWVSDEGVVFIAAAKQLIWGEGTGWQTFDIGRDANALWGFGATNVFAVTSASGAAGSPFLYNFSAQGWAEQPPNAGGAFQGLAGIWGNAADNVFAVGKTGTIIHYADREGTLEWAAAAESNNDPYALVPEPAAADEIDFEPSAIDILAIHGIGGEDIILSVTGLPQSDSTTLMHYRRYPE